MLDKIKTMLGQITPGPWEHHNWDVMEKPHVVPVTQGMGKRVCDGKFDLPITQTDAEFIALSPEFARWAVQEIERLQRELNHSQNNIKMAVSSIDHKNTEIERLREEVERSKQCQSCGGSGKVEVSHDPYMAYPCECVLFEEAIEKYPHLVQENNRFRAALEQMDDSKNPMMPRSQMASIAREALKCSP